MKKKTAVLVMVLLMTMSLLSGCMEGTVDIGALNDYISTLKGNLIGNDYKIQEYDNFGNLVFTVYGDKVSMSCEMDSYGEATSYVDIAIDGQRWEHVGSTLVFAQNGVDMITDFQIPEEMDPDNTSSGLMAVDRYINGYRNFFGKEKVVLVSSQNGTPIGLFQGDKCTVTIPGDLPKMTRVNIDGKSIYVHRANVDIIPVGMFK